MSKLTSSPHFMEGIPTARRSSPTATFANIIMLGSYSKFTATVRIVKRHAANQEVFWVLLCHALEGRGFTVLINKVDTRHCDTKLE